MKSFWIGISDALESILKISAGVTPDLFSEKLQDQDLLMIAAAGVFPKGDDGHAESATKVGIELEFDEVGTDRPSCNATSDPGLRRINRIVAVGRIILPRSAGTPSSDLDRN